MMGYPRADSQAEGRVCEPFAEAGFCQRRSDLCAVNQSRLQSLKGGLPPSA
jgi:hypothetical protein